MSKNDMAQCERCEDKGLHGIIGLCPRCGKVAGSPPYAAEQLMKKASEQHQGEPVALPQHNRITVDKPITSDPQGFVDGWNACVAQLAKLGPLYTHADPAEVERLRAEIEEWNRIFDMQEGKIDAIRAQLVERDALLREVLLGLWPSTPLAIKINAALSASAEPRAPVERDERAAFESAYPDLSNRVRWDPSKQEYRSGSKGLGWQDGLKATEWLAVWQARAAMERKP